MCLQTSFEVENRHPWAHRMKDHDIVVAFLWMESRRRALVLGLSLFLCATFPTYPHGGGLDAYGCHYNRKAVIARPLLTHAE
jgi:hypothetical protein